MAAPTPARTCERIGGTTDADVDEIATRLAPDETLLCVFKNDPSSACALDVSTWGCTAFVPLCWPFVGLKYALLGKRAVAKARYAVTDAGLYAWSAGWPDSAAMVSFGDLNKGFRPELKRDSFSCLCCIPKTDLFDIQVPQDTIGNHQDLVVQDDGSQDLVDSVRVALDAESAKLVKAYLKRGGSEFHAKWIAKTSYREKM